MGAHTPALAGVDSTLVFSVEQGKITDPAPRAIVEDALARVEKLKGVAPDRLFAMTTAYVTMQTGLNMTSSGSAGIVRGSGKRS